MDFHLAKPTELRQFFFLQTGPFYIRHGKRFFLLLLNEDILENLFLCDIIIRSECIFTKLYP